MSRIKTATDSDWQLRDDVTQAKYRKCRPEHFSQLPHYDHEILRGDMLFIFKIQSVKTGYVIADFAARPPATEFSYLDWEPRIRAYEEALPLLKLFLNFRFKAKSPGAKPRFENEVKLKTFAEDQSENVRLHLSGCAHFELSLVEEFCEAFGVDTISAVKREAEKLRAAHIEMPVATETLWYDFDDWLAEDQIAYYKKGLKDLKNRWLTQDAPSDILYSKLYEPYLSGAEPLPDQDAYVAKHIGDLTPYFRRLN